MVFFSSVKKQRKYFFCIAVIVHRKSSSPQEESKICLCLVLVTKWNFPPCLKYLINYCRIENWVTFNLVRRWAKATISVIFGLGVFKASNNFRNLSALLIKLEIYLNKLSNIKWSEQIRMLFICWWPQSNHAGTESAKNSSLYY